MDWISIAVGRLTMVLIAGMVLVMTYEIVLRYVFESSTLWATELSLWMAGFVFLFSGLYSMQQRAHIRIFVLYDLMPRSVQRICDLISTVLIVAFAIAIVWGGFNEARDKLLRWETFGTAFDPPIPATLKPLVLVIICLVAVQAVMNLICDWSKDKEFHNPADDLED
ncbi:TRAP transporter small permease [Paroceanicella profunda]|uniref:TRAP transporter small permease protein n=1 Tax=Paroceanicella profunda TaxID=2579971 RepID=A0A5B8FGN5_9RHOB|nr:TRAP transporter small permease [Paroceanicella profunda]QDL91451.1 TRAP transporter small permease [Paroceanicella profunda]